MRTALNKQKVNKGPDLEQGFRYKLVLSDTGLVEPVDNQSGKTLLVDTLNLEDIVELKFLSKASQPLVVDWLITAHLSVNQ